MKIRFLIILSCLALLIIGATTNQSDTDQITIHADRVLAPVNPLLFGQNYGPWMNTSEAKGDKKIRLLSLAVLPVRRSALSHSTKVMPISKTPTYAAPARPAR